MGCESLRIPKVHSANERSNLLHYVCYEISTLKKISVKTIKVERYNFFLVQNKASPIRLVHVTMNATY